MKGEMTKLRKIFIIHTLLDCNKWTMPDLIKEVNRLQSKYSKNHEKSNDSGSLFTPIDHPKMSPILTELINNKIVDTEPIPKSERKGRKGGRDFYWLVKTRKSFIRAYLNVIYLMPIGPKDFIKEGIHFTNSPFARQFLNDDIFSYIESFYKVQLLPMYKEQLLNVIKLSPLALSRMIQFCSEIRGEMKSKKKDQNKAMPPVYFMVPGLMSLVYSALVRDVEECPYLQESLGFDIKYTVLVRMKNDKKMTAVETEFNSGKMLGMGHNLLIQPLASDVELPGYINLIDQQKQLIRQNRKGQEVNRAILDVFKELLKGTQETINEHPELKESINKKIMKISTELKNAEKMK